MIIGLQEQFAIKGKQKLLTCLYNALPLVSEVLWKKDGTVVARNANTPIFDSRVAITNYNESQVKLSINATTTQDDENYTCLVTNEVGSSLDMSKSFIQGEANSSVDFVLITTMKQFYRMKHSTATLNDNTNKA